MLEFDYLNDKANKNLFDMRATQNQILLVFDTVSNQCSNYKWDVSSSPNWITLTRNQVKIKSDTW